MYFWETKIQKIGLSPKTKSIRSTHPERVYFTTTPELAFELANQLGAEKSQQTNPNAQQIYKKWALLQINVSKIPHTKYLSYFKVHKDHNTDEYNEHIPLYSNNYVPPTAITLLKTFDVY